MKAIDKAMDFVERYEKENDYSICWHDQDTEIWGKIWHEAQKELMIEINDFCRELKSVKDMDVFLGSLEKRFNIKLNK